MEGSGWVEAAWVGVGERGEGEHGYGGRRERAWGWRGQVQRGVVRDLGGRWRRYLTYTL